MTEHIAPFGVVTMERVGVDIYPLQSGVGLEGVITFGKYLGGGATNVSIAAARHDLRSVAIAHTENDPFGRYVHQELRRFGVDDCFVGGVVRLNTPVTFCEIFPPDDLPLYFYRDPIAPDLTIEVDPCPAEVVNDDVLKGIDRVPA